MSELGADLLQHFVAQQPTALLRPVGFFVAQYGVLALVYDGFPRSLLDLKARLEAEAPGLPPENPGSRWPKTTLAALHDGQHLSVADLHTLRDLCDEAVTRLVDTPLVVEELAAVVYTCRSLEQRLLTHRFPLDPALPRDEAPPPARHRAHVAQILQQFDRTELDWYGQYARMEGHRASHYRDPCSEATLICELPPLPAAVDHFQAAVEAALPGKYAWFAAASRHLTVRALALDLVRFSAS